MEDNLISQQDEKKRFLLRKPIRIIAQILLYSIIMVQAMVTNTFNSTNSNIRASLRITDKTHGIFTLIYNIGQFLSAICVILIMRRPERKSTVLYSVFTTFAAVMFFQFTDNQMIIMTIYFFTGFCVMVMNVYISLWIDQLAIFSFKTIFLALTNVCRSSGICCGILLNYYFGADNFTKSFLVEGILLGIIGFAVIQIPSVYFNGYLLLSKGKFGEQKFNMNRNKKEEEDSKSLDKEDSVYRFRHSGISTKDEYIIWIIYSFSKNKRYVFGLISNVILITATAGFGNYSMGFINSYFTDVNGGQTKILKNKILFTLTGPICAFFIIIVLSCFIGNYYSKTTPAIMFTLYLIVTITGNVIPSLSTPRDLSYAALIYNIASSTMGPYVQGTNLSAGTPSKKPFGVTINIIAGIILGQIPAPYIYATLLKNFPKEEVLNIFMRFLIVGAIFNFLMMVFRFKEYPPEKEKPKPAIELSDK